MRALIFTEGGSQIGFGHISRCCSLYDELESRGIEAEFIISGDKQVEDVLGSRKYRIVNWIEDDKIKKFNIKNNYCIIDSYKAEESIYFYIAKHTNKLLFIDDYNRINYPNGIVVNPSIYTEEHNYLISKSIKYLLGKDYIILREAFKQNNSHVTKQEVKEVLVTLGGSDLRYLTPKILEVLQSYPELRKNVVIGNGYNNIEEIRKRSDQNTNFYFNLNEEDMKNLIYKSDVAITAAGQTIYELIRGGTPFIPIQVVDNQIFTAKGLIKYNLVEKIILWNSSNFQQELFFEFEKIIKTNKRSTLSEKYKNFIDGLGASRIISELLKDVSN